VARERDPVGRAVARVGGAACEQESKNDENAEPTHAPKL
jgi:hypothetical protein